MPRRSLSKPEEETFVHSGDNSSSAHGRHWDEIFDLLTEVFSCDPTRFIAESMKLNKIDRYFNTVPSHAC